MRILIVTPYYTPDLGPSAPMFALLSTALIELGHTVTVISMVPNYPSGQVLPSYRGIRVRHSTEEGVEVLRIPIPSMDRENFIKRMLQFGIYQVGATLATLTRDFDAVIISNPFFCSLLPILWHTSIRRKPTIYSVHDVYPEVGIKLGIFKHKLQIKFIKILERFCMLNATLVQILTSTFRPALISMGVPDSKIIEITPWVDTQLIRPLPQENPFADENGFQGRFVVLYAGNIGLSQGFEDILLAAERLANQPEILFVFVGDGSGLQTLRSLVADRMLGNVLFIPFQPRERLAEVLASADISIVSLKQGIGSASLPSKVFSIMASKRPMLVCVEQASETWQLVKKADAGLWVLPGDPAMLIEAIQMLKQDESLRERLGQNGRNWVENNHSPQQAAQQFEKYLLASIKMRA
jgi:colanic acid biosynthesis glycosyl transferase WcaI